MEFLHNFQFLVPGGGRRRALWPVALATLLLALTGAVTLEAVVPSPAAAQERNPFAPDPPDIDPITGERLTPPNPITQRSSTAGDPNPVGDGNDSGDGPDGAISIDIGTPGQEVSQSVVLIVGLGVLSLAPSLVLMLSSFTRIIIVLSLTRNALGLQGVPPNQVLVGLALFLSLFIMAPVLTTVNDEAISPFMDGQITQDVAFERASEPIRGFMLENTRESELELMLEADGQERPDTVDDVGLTALIPAFLLSELKTAFIMGFVIFIPFLIVDIIVSAALMSLGMMMLPPVFVSLPFKLLLFVMVGGWSLIAETLLASFT